MDSNKTPIEIVDSQTGEVWTLSAASLVSDVNHIFLSKRRQQIASALWKDLSESQQQDEITSTNEFARDLVTKVVEIIATGNQPVIHALLGHFKSKDGMIEISAKGRSDDAALLSLNSVGKKALKIIVADAEQFDEKGEAILPDPDQPELDMEDDKTDDAVVGATGALADQLKEAGYNTDETPNNSEQWEGGFNSRMGLHEISENPFDTDTDSHHDWSLGWNAADNDEYAPDFPEPGPEEDEPGAPKSTPKQLGSLARMNGSGKDENPFDGGTDDFNDWVSGWQYTDEEFDAVRLDGYRARADGNAPTKNPWKKSEISHTLWAEGYEKAKSEGLPEE